MKKINCKIAIIFLLFTTLTACEPVPPMPDAVTNHYPANISLSGKQIIESKSVNLKKYNLVLVRSGTTPDKVGAFLSGYVATAIANLKIFHHVETPYTLAQAFHGDSSIDDMTDLLSTGPGIKKLNEIYGKILVLDANFYQKSFGGDFEFKLYDPAIDKIFFSVFYNSNEIFLNNGTYPFLNALSDWTKKNN